MFWAVEAVPKIVLTSPRLRIASTRKAYAALNPAPGRVAPRRPLLLCAHAGLPATFAVTGRARR
jgi:hypothetical protein